MAVIRDREARLKSEVKRAEQMLRMANGMYPCANVEEEKEMKGELVMNKPLEDNWKHRSEGMRCRTCMWFAPKQGEVGRCRRHAPTMGGYPVVYETDWCGDHKLDENILELKEEAPKVVPPPPSKPWPWKSQPIDGEDEWPQAKKDQTVPEIQFNKE